MRISTSLSFFPNSGPFPSGSAVYWPSRKMDRRNDSNYKMTLFQVRPLCILCRPSTLFGVHLLQLSPYHSVVA